MKLHSTVIERLVKIYETYGGYSGEKKLREELARVNLSTYDQKTGNRETLVVLTEDLMRYTKK